MERKTEAGRQMREEKREQTSQDLDHYVKTRRLQWKAWCSARNQTENSHEMTRVPLNGTAKERTREPSRKTARDRSQVPLQEEVSAGNVSDEEGKMVRRTCHTEQSQRREKEERRWEMEESKEKTKEKAKENMLQELELVEVMQGKDEATEGKRKGKKGEERNWKE